MPIYFGSNFAREPFQFDSVGNDWEQESVTDRKSTRLNSSHTRPSRMPSSA